MIRKLKAPGLIIAAVLFFTAQSCTNNPRQNQEDTEVTTVTTTDVGEQNIQKAICVLHPTEGNTVSGTVTFTQNGEGVMIEADIEGLTPGKHGFHIHEFGDCSAADASSAGGHFNPGNNNHGGPDSEERHVGDLGNIEAGDDGRVQVELNDSLLSFSGANSIIGRSVVVHAGEDDLTSQPSGDAGGRVACGVIGVME